MQEVIMEVVIRDEIKDIFISVGVNEGDLLGGINVRHTG
jgi:hypothetical protein